MTPLDDGIWARLANDRPHGETLTARYAIPETTERLLAALDADARRHLLIELREGDEPLSDSDSRGLRIATRELAIPGHAAGSYIDLACVDPQGYAALDVIGGEVGEGLAQLGADPALIVSRVLAKWRRFWGHAPTSLLPLEKQIGLFAELWFLLWWMLPATNAATATQRWRGPYGARHDFEWLGRSIEVKASSTVDREIFRIHGLEQLDPPQPGDLFLFGLRVREEAGASHNLVTVVDQIRLALAPDASSLDLFESALSRAGYTPLHEPDYSRVHWRVVSERFYFVDAAFPKLTPASLLGGEAPAGVIDVSYSIDLTAYRGQIAEDAAAAASYLAS